MSETHVETFNADKLVDMFPDLGNSGSAGGGSNVKFGMAEIGDVDILTKPQSTSTTEETTQASTSTTEETTLSPENVDILGTGVETKVVEKSTIGDLTTYYQDRIKNGKFIAIEEEDEKGNKIPFIPKTPEEYDEVLELQINYRLDEAKKDLEKRWYESKSPAWKAISQYAELVDDPSQLIPFLQGVRTLTTVANLDENDNDAAEQIVRTRLSQRGDTEEIISQQVEALKTTGKLLNTAKQYKPIMLQEEQQKLAADMKRQQEEQQKYQSLVQEIRESAIKSIDAPIFGKQKLKNEEKAAIYDLIGEPSETTQGYAIYSAIDNLFETKNFDTLKEIALLLSKKDSFYNYLGISVANNTAASLERKLRVAGESRSSSGNDFTETGSQPSVSRNQFKTKPTFGRNS